MKPRNRKLPPFVPLTKATMKTPAWKAMSHGARSLYAALKGRYNRNLQNGVYLSTRDASDELGNHSRRESIQHWFKEIEFYGFTRMVSPAHHGLHGHGKAPHWRLTEESFAGKPPTRDYLNWTGELFPKRPTREASRQFAQDHFAKNRSRGPHATSTVARTGGPVVPRTS